MVILSLKLPEMKIFSFYKPASPVSPQESPVESGVPVIYYKWAP